MEVQHLFDNLLSSINWHEAAENSYTSFHAPGVNYLNLLRSERLTVKLYTFEKVQHNAQGFLVHPHTHAYNFTHRTMVGTIQNHKFEIGEGRDWDLYSVSTPLNGGDGLTKLLPCGLETTALRVLSPGEHYYLDHREVHTISVHTDYAAAVLLQFHDRVPGTVMFAPHDETPDCSTGLYHRMTAGEGSLLVERYRTMCSRNNIGKGSEIDV